MKLSELNISSEFAAEMAALVDAEVPSDEEADRQKSDMLASKVRTHLDGITTAVKGNIGRLAA